MTDNIENLIRGQVSARVKAQFPDTVITTEYSGDKAKFPMVTLEEKDNTTYKRTITNSGESHAVIVYEVGIYSNLQTGAREQCKKIAKIICDYFEEMKFTRNMLGFIPNAADTSIKRMAGRFTAVQGIDNRLYII